MSEEQPTRAELEDMSIGDLHAWVEAAQNAQEAANRIIDSLNHLHETFMSDVVDETDDSHPYWPLEAFRWNPDLSEEEWRP